MRVEARRRVRAAGARFVAVALAGTLLSACGNIGGIRQQLGLDKSPPDEFRIVSRPPLSMPPEYALRPPQPGAPRPQETPVVERARQTVFRAEPTPGAATRELSPGASGGEAALLRQAGADRADPNIREVLAREGTKVEQPDRGFVERLAFWREAPPPGVVVDPDKEAQRIRENQALGRPVTEGETPVIRRRRRGLLEGVF
ncbi:MAG: DUF3035 domain-containing protein [Alphaproteobacteria bacterium]|nr:DUF3035 domain-containing protein [Alphaproteobacteria bacterium]